MIWRLSLHRFENISDRSDKSTLTLQGFKNSLGLMGFDNYLVNRIFSLLDTNGDGIVTFEDFLNYLKILINGTQLEKALWSFRMLSSSQISITYEDLEKLVFDIACLWVRAGEILPLSFCHSSNSSCLAGPAPAVASAFLFVGGDSPHARRWQLPPHYIPLRKQGNCSNIRVALVCLTTRTR